MNKTCLHWSYRDLKIIPEDDLKKYAEHLEEVYLKENFISSIPQWLLKLNNLKFIHLAGNTLKEIPDEINSLENLEFLDVSDNCLKVLPKSIGKLINLKSFNASGNYLETVPETIGNLKELQSLNISGNMINSIPDEIGHCGNLLEMILSDNFYLLSIPEKLSSLKLLEKLCADRCGLLYLPGLLSESITHLRIFNNRFLTHIPVTYEKFFRNYYEMYAHPPCKIPRTGASCYTIREKETHGFLRLSYYTRQILKGDHLAVPSLFDCVLRKINSITEKGTSFQIDSLPVSLQNYIKNGPFSECCNLQCKQLIFCEYYLLVVRRFHSKLIFTCTFCSPKCASNWSLVNKFKYYIVEWEDC